VAPDQATTGAILSAPLGTALPTSPSAELNVAFGDSGYVGEDGLTFAEDRSTNDVKDWSGNVVRKILQSWAGDISWAHLEVNLQSLKNAFGEDQVTTDGNVITVKIGGFELPRKSWVFRMKDGDRRMLLAIPDGQITAKDDISFVAGEPITLPVTLSCYPDTNGVSIYWLLDDGTVITDESSSS
jgi:hypothetical protein